MEAAKFKKIKESNPDKHAKQYEDLKQKLEIF